MVAGQAPKRLHALLRSKQRAQLIGIGKRLKPLNQADIGTFGSVRFVLTDMDDTLTYRGRLAARTYDALERVQKAGIVVIPVTAAPAGWCDQMARMWPIDGVIGENGGFFFRRNGEGHDLSRTFWYLVEQRSVVAAELAAVRERIVNFLPDTSIAEDQPFRLTSLAFNQPDNPITCAALIVALRNAGLSVTLNNLWVLGWLGAYDKLTMARRILLEVYGVDIDKNPEAVLYVGDSTNDAPMFEFFPHAVGVSTVINYLSEIAVPPKWVTAGPGGNGFVEVVDALNMARSD